MASAKAKVSRDQPCVSVIGTRNRPRIDLGPKEIIEIRQPQTTTTQRAVWVADLPEDRGGELAMVQNSIDEKPSILVTIRSV
ncbi:MAG: hypothetical protein Rhims3KO_01740 [Hyphomicrobiales bacterium]